MTTWNWCETAGGWLCLVEAVGIPLLLATAFYKTRPPKPPRRVRRGFEVKQTTGPKPVLPVEKKDDHHG